MNEQQTYFQKAVDIVNSTLIYVFLSNALVLIFTIDLIKNVGLVSTLVLIFVKTYLDSGIYGTFTELVSGEEITLSKTRFYRNAKDHWVIYFLMTVLLFFIRGLGTLISVDYFNFNFMIFDLFLNVLFICSVAYVMFYRKYKRRFRLPGRKIFVERSALVIILGFCCMDGLLAHLPRTIHSYNIYISGLFILISIYARLVIFVYLSILIHDQYPEIKRKFSYEKELFLIAPCAGRVWEDFVFFFTKVNPPIFTVLKAHTPKRYKVRKFSHTIWRKRYFQSNKLVGITCVSKNSAEAYRIAKEFRRRGSKVVMGGWHVTHFPEEALEYCDSIVIGEAEGVWSQIVTDYENGALKKRYRGIATEQDYAKVHQELLQSPPYVIKDFLETTRGCKYQCEFCTIPVFNQRNIRNEPVENIVALMKKLKHRYKMATFIDNNIYANPAYAKQLFVALKSVGIKWGASSSMDIAKDAEALRLAKEGGCDRFLFGYEIFGGSHEEKKKGGKLAMADHYSEFTQKVNKSGIRIEPRFIFGFDTDRYKHLFNILKSCVAVHGVATGLSILTPLPGSRLYLRLLKENKITTLNWRNYNGKLMLFNHPHINRNIINKSFVFISLFLLLTTKIGLIAFLTACHFAYFLIWQ